MLLGATACDEGFAGISSVQAGPEVATVSITPVEIPSLALGQLVVLQAQPRDANGVALSNRPVIWNASDPAVVRLQLGAGSNTLYVVALRAGTTTLTAKSGTTTANVTIVVHAPGPVTTIAILSESEVVLGKTVQLRVVQRDSEDVVLSAPIPTFSSSDSTIARVSATGLVTAVAQGTATVTASSEGKSASRKLTVIASEHAFIWTAATGMIDLGTLPGFVSSRAVAVSSAGHVAGSLSGIGDSLTHAFVRSPEASAELRDLGGLPGGRSSQAFGVNSAGQVVGYATTATGAPHAVLWRPNGAIVDLGAPLGGESVALGISNAGQVVGWTGTGTLIQPFIWTETSGMQIIAGIRSGIAFAINNSGVVAGESNGRPISWNAGSSASVLNLLRDDVAGRARAISDAGEMVGSSSGCEYAYYYYDEDCDAVDHPVMWTSNNVPTDLRRTASATTIAYAVGINSAHQLVGSNDSRHAILWSASSGLRDLGVLPGRLWSAATAINDAGVVVGSSSNP